MTLTPYDAKVEAKKLLKIFSTASTMTSVISARRQATLIHDLPLQLCPSWPLFAVKGRYTGVYISTFFKGFATTRAKKNLRGASAVILFSEKIL